MPKRGRGEQSWQQVKQLVETLFDYELHERKDISHLDIYWKASTGADLKVKATMQALWHLLKDRDVFKPKNSTSDKQICNYIGEVLTIELRDFLEILEDHRDESERRGKSNWKFTLKLWSQEHKTENLENLKKLWNTKKQAAGITSNSGQAAGITSNSRQATGTTRGTRVVGLQNIIDVPVWKGRDEILAELKAKLLHPQNPPKVLAIIGQGGIGKTSLAVKLMESVGVNLSGLALAADSPYDCALYFKVQEGTSFDDVAEFLLGEGLRIQTPEPLKTADEKIAKIIEGLAQNRFLLVLDNLEDILHPAKHSQARKSISPDWGKLLNALVYNQHQSQTILTCREVPADLGDSRSKKATINRKLVQVEKLLGVDTEASVEILKEYGLRDSEEDLQWIAERVKGHVFVLEMLGNNYADEPGKLRKHPELVTDEVEVILTEQLARQSEAACDLLRRMCVLRVPIDIPGLTFLRLYTDDDYRFERAAILEEPAELTEEEIRETEAILERLVDSSLVQSRYSEEKCEVFYDLHRVIVEFLQVEYQAALPKLLESVYKFYCTGKNVENPKTLEDLRPVLEAQHFAFMLGNYSEASNLLMWTLEQCLRTWGYWNFLKDLYEQILPHVEDDNRPVCLRQIGRIYSDFGYWDIAEKYFKDALVIEQEEEDKRGIANSLGCLGHIEGNRGNWDEAERLYRQCLELWTELGDRSGMASSWGHLGDIERNRGNWDEAERLYRQSLELRTELGDRSGMAFTLGSLGVIKRDTGKWDEAEQLFQQAVDLMRELGTRSGIAAAWGCLGDIERLRSNFDAAEQFKQQSFQLRQELGDREGMAMSLCAWGEIKHARGDFNAADQLYQQSLQIRQKLGDTPGIAIVKGCLGKNKVSQGNLEEAEQILSEALSTMQKLNMSYEIAEAKYDLARIYRQRNNPELAQQHYNSAHQIFQQLGATKDLERIEREWHNPDF